MKLVQSRRALLVVAVVFVLALLAAGGQTAMAQDAQWHAQFWNNTNLSGTPVLTRWENTIDFNWFGGSPDPRVNSDNFSARWTRTVNFPAGNYRFNATMDDGMRIWIDNQLVVDSWTHSQEHTMSFDRFMNGNHDIRIDYFEAGGMAVARFNWSEITAGSSGGPLFPNWRATYFNRPDLSGAPVLVRDDRYINFNWGLASPGPGVNADFWSVRWTRQINALPGQYRIILSSDDGSRLFINNQLIVDNWRDQATTRTSSDFFWNGGVLNVVIEYYDASGPAFFNANLITVSGGTGTIVPSPAPPTGGACATAPTGNNAQSIATTALNIRRGPGTQFETMGQMAPCEVRQLSGFRNGDSTWVQIVTANGQTGWVSAQYVRLGVNINTLAVP